MDAPAFKSRRAPPRLVVFICTYCFEEGRARANRGKAAAMATTTPLLAAAALLALLHPCAAAYFPVSTKSPVAAPPQFIVFTCALHVWAARHAVCHACRDAALYTAYIARRREQKGRAAPPDGRRRRCP